MKMTMTHRQLRRLCQMIVVDEVDRKVHELTDKILGPETLDDYSDDELDLAVMWRARQIDEARNSFKVVS